MNTLSEMLALKEQQPCAGEPNHDPNAPYIAFGVPACLFGAACFGMFLEHYGFLVRGANFLRIANLKHYVLIRVLMFTCMLIISCAWVGHAEIIKMQPRLADGHQFLMLLVDVGSAAVLLPVGIYLRGWEDVRMLAKPVFGLSCLFGIVYLLFISGLANMSPATFMIIFQIQPVFVYPMELVLFGKTFIPSKCAAVVLGLVGLTFMFYNDKSSSYGHTEPVIGYTLAGLSVLIYSIYQICYLLFIPKPEQGSTTSSHVSFLTLFMGLRGFFTLLMALPVYGYWLSDDAYFENQFGCGFPSFDEISAMVGAGVTMWIFVYAQIIAITNFSVVWVAMASSLSIPLSVLIDMEYHDLVLSSGVRTGAVLILAAFVWMSWADYLNSQVRLDNADHYTSLEGYAKKGRVDLEEALGKSYPSHQEWYSEYSSVSERPSICVHEETVLAW